MTTPDALESLDEAGLQQVIARASELLREREQEKKRAAIEQARAILADAGLSPQDLIGGGAGRPRKQRSSSSGASSGGQKKGQRYANPANAAQVYEVGRGREPNWFKALKASGELPTPLAG